MNTDKICIFTDNGQLHQIKVKDIPFLTKFRDKGTPIDNLGNFLGIRITETNIILGRKA